MFLPHLAARLGLEVVGLGRETHHDLLVFQRRHLFQDIGVWVRWKVISSWARLIFLISTWVGR